MPPVRVVVDARSLHDLLRNRPIRLPWNAVRPSYIVTYHEYVFYCDLVSRNQPRVPGRWNAARLDIRQVSWSYGNALRMCSPDADSARYIDGMKRTYDLDDKDATNILVIEQEDAKYCAAEEGLSSAMERALIDRGIGYAVRALGEGIYRLRADQNAPVVPPGRSN